MRTTPVLIAMLLVVAGCGDRPGRPDPAAATSGSSARYVVPWRPLAPTRPRLRLRRLPPRPDPAAARRAPVCLGTSLRAVSAGYGGAAGTAVLPIRLRLRRFSRPCRVQGVPSVLAHTPTRTLPGTLSTWSRAYRSPVLVTRRSPALVFVTWPDLCLQHGESHVVLGWRGATWRFAAGSAGAACSDLADGRPPSSIGVSQLQPPHVRPARSVSPYDAIRVRSLTRLAPGPGHTLDFVVTLVARHDTPLRPCPDYLLLGSMAPRRLALDCAGVPFRDRRGDPSLPAGRPVRFAMRTAWSPSSTKLCWELLDPGTPPQDCVAAPPLTDRAGAPDRR